MPPFAARTPKGPEPRVSPWPAQPLGPGDAHRSWDHTLTRATDRGFDARLLQHWHPADGTLDVLGKDVPVQIKEAKGKRV